MWRRLSDANTLANGGTLDPGGTGIPVTAALAGKLTQGAGGTLAVDVSFNGNAASSDLRDYLNQTGAVKFALRF